MKKVLAASLHHLTKNLISLFLLSSITSTAQINTNSEWTWIKGDSISGAAGVYGIQGIADDANKPGARMNAISWTDNSGNFYLFGGHASYYFNDLWKYNNISKRWTWLKGDSTETMEGIFGIQGIPSITNKPGPRVGSVSWTDASGNLWLFGGYGYNFYATTGALTNALNDLWRYEPSTNMWTWMKGEYETILSGNYGTRKIASMNNEPPGRDGGVSWVDESCNFWLFGGNQTVDTFYLKLNDLWKYEPLINQWTWMNGDNIFDVSGIYGIQGVSSATTKPGARVQSVSLSNTQGSAGSLWLFGGYGFDGAGNIDHLNDLWKYDILTNQWTWVKGDSSLDVPGVYGIQGIAAEENKPGARYAGVSWKDALGNLWLFGGGNDNLPLYGLYNDLWKYNPTTNQWTWMKGDSIINLHGIYGLQGHPAPDNKPGGRSGSVSWKDASGNLFLLGGWGYPKSGLYPGLLSDLWQLGNITVLPLTLINISAQPIQNDILVSWQTSQEINTSQFIIEHSKDGRTFFPIGSVTASGNSLSFRNYSFTDQHPFTSINYYRLKIMDTDGKFSYSKVVIVSMNEVNNLNIFPNPAHDILFVQVNGTNEMATVQILDAIGRKVKEQKVTLATTTTISVRELPKGLYHLLLINSSIIRHETFMKE